MENSASFMIAASEWKVTFQQIDTGVVPKFDCRGAVSADFQVIMTDCMTRKERPKALFPSS